jgi:hypothetical protein
MSMNQRLRTSPARTALLDFIQRVISMCAEEQMIRSDAWWIVALVQDKLTVWNLAIRQFPRDAMGWTRRLSIEFPKRSVSESRCAAAPNPASVGLFNLCPEAVGDRRGWSCECGALIRTERASQSRSDWSAAASAWPYRPRLRSRSGLAGLRTVAHAPSFFQDIATALAVRARLALGQSAANIRAEANSLPCSWFTTVLTSASHHYRISEVSVY